MKIWVVASLLGSISLTLQLVSAQKCNLDGAKQDVPFPNIEQEGVESYILSVEYSIPGASQTDYFVEYYDTLERTGRVDSHQAGKSLTYIYRTEYKEAWEITRDNCKLQDITDTPTMYKSDQTEWTYMPAGKDDKITIGPSAMFKNALVAFNDKNIKTAYMGEANVRGLTAQYWRRCIGDNAYVDYYFSASKTESPYELSFLKMFPLRVSFNGSRKGEEAGLSEQRYDVISFQPFIPADTQPFELPKGKGCKRSESVEPPEIPNFLEKNLMFSAEVIYRKIDRNGDSTEFWSYYSTLMMALDQKTQHLAYYYTPWNSTKQKDDEEPTALAPEYIIYDMKHGYQYKTKMSDASCTIIRGKNFAPQYKLPKEAGSITLTDPSILFPYNQLTFISEGTNRGLKVNVFEEIAENYVLDKIGTGEQVQIPKAIITHSYLQDNEVERNTGSVKNALAQVRVRLIGRQENVDEIITFNFFGFSTEIRNRRIIFNIARCFKNDDDYSWVTIGFNADQSLLDNIKEDVPSIQSNILNELELKSELNPVRIPYVLIDVNDGLFVSMLILDKPPVMLDFVDPVDDQMITDATDVEGALDITTCANMCLETEDNCWGFSICGAKCSFGSDKSKTIGKKEGCTLLNRYKNGTDSFIPSKELMIENLRREVEEGDVKLLLLGKDEKRVQLEANYIEVNDPGEDDRLFNRIGNFLNPRMKVLKAGYKLKSTSGAAIKNMGQLRYDECQRVCLDFKDCETVSYCLLDSECVINKKYGDDIKDNEIEEDTMCNLLTRKYADHFDRSPGNVLSITAEEVLDIGPVDDCARACLKQTKYECLSFDHCPAAEKGMCKLHTVYYPNPQTREKVQKKDTNCGHYFRKYSTEFKKNPEKRTLGSKLPPLTNLTLEECSKSCMEYGKGTCYGFDFCQNGAITATSCTLLDSDPSQMKTAYSPICTNYLRNEPEFAPNPYSTSYAGGIGFVCFFVAAIVGAAIVFGIAYFRVNRR